MIITNYYCPKTLNKLHHKDGEEVRAVEVRKGGGEEGCRAAVDVLQGIRWSGEGWSWG